MNRSTPRFIHTPSRVFWMAALILDFPDRGGPFRMMIWPGGPTGTTAPSLQLFSVVLDGSWQVLWRRPVVLNRSGFEHCSAVHKGQHHADFADCLGLDRARVGVQHDQV